MSACLALYPSPFHGPVVADASKIYTLGWVLETTVHHGAEELGLEHEIAEVRRVHANIVAPVA